MSLDMTPFCIIPELGALTRTVPEPMVEVGMEPWGGPGTLLLSPESPKRRSSGRSLLSVFKISGTER